MHITVEKAIRSAICNTFDVHKSNIGVNNGTKYFGHLMVLKVFHEFTPLIVVVSF